MKLAEKSHRKTSDFPSFQRSLKLDKEALSQNGILFALHSLANLAIQKITCEVALCAAATIAVDRRGWQDALPGTPL